MRNTGEPWKEEGRNTC